VFKIIVALGAALAFSVACAQDRASAASGTAGAATTVSAGDAKTMTPLDRVKATPKGQLKNPYTDDNAEIVAQGRKIYLGYSCNGCHGGMGGGGMCPPISNDTWVYGGDDDTLFRLVALGSVDLQKEGYTRKGTENVVGPMPPHGKLIKTDDELWKILAFLRSNYRGSPAKKFGSTPATPPPP